MNIFFDMDYTILALGGALRPGTQQVFQQLRDDGHTLYIWSGVGVRSEEVRRLGLDVYVDGVFEKPLHDYHWLTLGMLRRGEIPVFPDLVVDDYPEVVAALGGIVVRPYVNGHPSDREMEQVYRIIRDFAATGRSEDPAFRPGPERPET